jgi:hypothetical protein
MDVKWTCPDNWHIAAPSKPPGEPMATRDPFCSLRTSNSARLCRALSPPAMPSHGGASSPRELSTYT